MKTERLQASALRADPESEEFPMKKTRQLIGILILTVLAVRAAGIPADRALADKTERGTVSHYPEAGNRIRTDDMLTIDYSHMEQGYVMVRAEKTDRRMQLVVDRGTDSLHYEINGEGKPETIPLQMGSGNYRFTLWIAQNRGSSRCVKAGTVTLSCAMKDETSCFLYPNQYVSYSSDDLLVQKAQELCEGLADRKEIAETICRYVRDHFDYDWIKANQIQANGLKGILPDIAGTWETKKGICQDKSALLCAMLRCMGIPAKLAIGEADGKRHAWVVMILDGKTVRFDPTAKAGTYKAERYY